MTEQLEARLEADMKVAVRGLLGEGYEDDYYADLAHEFVQIAVHHAEAYGNLDAAVWQVAAEGMADTENYKAMRAAGSVHPCEVAGCRLSQEEHHRLSFGIMAENRDLKRRLQAVESGAKCDRDE